MTEDLSTQQRLQSAAMLTDALSNLIDRSKHLCQHNNHPENTVHKDHTQVQRQMVQLTAATLTEAIQALVPALKVEVAEEGPGNVDEALAGLVNATAARL